MEQVQMKDGNIEYVSSYYDIIDIVREKCGDDLADLLEYDYGYHKTYETIINNWDAVRECRCKIYNQKSIDTDELLQTYDDLFWLVNRAL